MDNRLDLLVASYRERVTQLVGRYEDEIAQIRVDATQEIERLRRRVEELEAAQKDSTEVTNGEN